MQVAEALGKVGAVMHLPDAPLQDPGMCSPSHGECWLLTSLNPLQGSQSELPHPSLRPLPRENPYPVTVPFGAIQAWNPCPDSGQYSELPVGSAEASAAAAWKLNFSISPILAVSSVRVAPGDASPAPANPVLQYLPG